MLAVTTRSAEERLSLLFKQFYVVTMLINCLWCCVETRECTKSTQTVLKENHWPSKYGVRTTAALITADASWVADLCPVSKLIYGQMYSIPAVVYTCAMVSQEGISVVATAHFTLSILQLFNTRAPTLWNAVLLNILQYWIVSSFKLNTEQ